MHTTTTISNDYDSCRNDHDCGCNSGKKTDRHAHGDGTCCQSEHSAPDKHAHAHGDDTCCHSEHSAPDLSTYLPSASGQWLRIMEMDCVVEESQIRLALESMAGIQKLEFKLQQRALHIDASDAVIEQAIVAIRRLGFQPKPIVSGAEADCNSCDIGANFTPSTTKQWVMMGGALVLALFAEGIHFVLPEQQPWTAINMVIAGIAIALSGFEVYRKGLRALMQGNLNINALMTVAVTGAFVIGQWAEAAMVMSLYTIAEWLEGRSADKARQAVADLLTLAPEQADIQQADGTWRMMPVANVAVGSIFQVKAGERIALDGVVEYGYSAVNQAPVTGESTPVDKQAGDTVFAGTINTNGLLQVRSTADASNTTLARIIATVEQAQANRAPIQSTVDKFAAIYTPLVFVVACAVALGGALIFNWTWLDAIYKALVLLVIACPCALVLSTPITIVSALASAAKRGILIKGGKYLEQARRIRAIAFDKTGTLTVGKPTLQTHAVLDTNDINSLFAAHALALASNHPVSIAIAEGLQPQLPKMQTQPILTQVCTVAGKGIQACIDGQRLFLGSIVYIQANSHVDTNILQTLQAQQKLGYTITVLADEHNVRAWFAVADAIKPQAQAAVATLQNLGVHTVVLSGDHPQTVQAIAKQAGISHAQGSLLPEHKLKAISELQQQQGITAMVGDGINDAPALSQSDLGFAMGSVGTDVALESADVVVMNDDLHRVAETVRLSRYAYTVLWQNICLALGVKAAFLALTLAGHGAMWMAVIADVGTSLLVVLNGLRLLRWRG